MQNLESGCNGILIPRNRRQFALEHWPCLPSFHIFKFEDEASLIKSLITFCFSSITFSNCQVS